MDKSNETRALQIFSACPGENISSRQAKEFGLRLLEELDAAELRGRIAEREACAALAEQEWHGRGPAKNNYELGACSAAHGIAANIRARTP